jgi:hypothetical protein
MGHAPTDAARSEARRLLAIYLRDHRAGAESGLSLAERIQRANDGTDVGAAMASLAADIAEDRRSLEQIMERFGVRPSTVKDALGSLAERAGRLKANGRLVGYSPLSLVIELEALAGGVFGKRNLWRALAAIAERHPELDGGEAQRLIDRAEQQLELVLDLHRRAAGRAFGAGAPAPSTG